MRALSFLFAITVSFGLYAQEEIRLKASDMISGRAADKISGLVETAKAQQTPVLVEAPDHWRDKVIAMLRKSAGEDVIIRSQSTEADDIRLTLQNGVALKKQSTPSQKLTPDTAIKRDDKRVEYQPIKANGEPTVKSIELASKPTLGGLMPLEKPRRSTSSGTALSTGTRHQGSISKETPDEASKELEETALSPKTEPGSQRVKETPKPVRKSPTASKPVEIASASQPPKEAAEEKLETNAETHAEIKPESTQKKEALIAADRIVMEGWINEGKAIKKRITPKRLKMGDTLYVGSYNIVVIRFDGLRKRHFWLQGSVDLKQRTLKQTGKNRYKIQGRLKEQK